MEIKYLDDSELDAVVPVFESRKGQNFFLFSKTFRPALAPTQVLTQCVPGGGGLFLRR